MASESVIIVAALLLLNIVMANRVPFEPPAAAVAATTQDQYEMGEDRPRKSTDHLSKSPDSINPENIAMTTNEDIYESKKNKRSYYPYPIPAIQSVSAYHSVSIWQPPPYELSRPYFIPIYGIHGQIPIYYPPQPLIVYPQQPVYKGPEYLPPKETNTTEKPTDTTMTIGERFNDFDEQPVWDAVTTTTENPRSSNNIVPTRRPRPQRVSTHPPLIHDTTTTATRQSEVAPPSIETGGAFAPPNQQQQVGPSRCVWAIVSCCSRGRKVPTECFEFHGCPGPFWDASPCESDFAKAAIETALKYYNSK